MGLQRDTRPRARYSNLLEVSRQFHCSAQEAHIVVSGNFDTAKLLQMRREPLCVEQDELARAQTFHQCYERNLGRIGHEMKH